MLKMLEMLLVVFGCYLLVCPSAGLLVTIGARDQECFIEYIKTKRTAFMRIAVLEAGGEQNPTKAESLSIRIKAFGPFDEAPKSNEEQTKEFFNQLILTKVKEGVVVDSPADSKRKTRDSKTENGFNFDTEHRGGFYKFCLDNTHDTWDNKVVDFHTSFGLTAKDDLGHEDVAESQTKEKYRKEALLSIDRIFKNLQAILDEQRYYGSRAKRHSETLKSNQSRIFWYTSFQILAVLGLFGVQIYILHQWFKDNGGYGGKQWA